MGFIMRSMEGFWTCCVSVGSTAWMAWAGLLPARCRRIRSDPRHQAGACSVLCWFSADVSYNQLLDDVSVDDRIRLFSAGGPTAGSSLVAQMSLPTVHFTDAQWTEALRFRLGVPRHGPLPLCRNQKQSGEECGERLQPNPDHELECPSGPLRTRRHDDLAECHADIAEEAGAVVRREVYVDELSGTSEAWLDVWAYGLPEATDILLDITVRHPRAARYRPQAEAKPGHAAAEAEGEKQERYPATSREVWPIAHETWGRLGVQAEQFLIFCAAAARRRAHRRGRASGTELTRWRACLDACLQKSVAMQLLTARRGMPGRAAYRRRPQDLAALETHCPV